MANPLYDMFGKSQNKNNAVMNIMNEARLLKQNMKGNAKEEVQKLLSSGQMSQSDFDRLMPIAQNIANMMSKK